MGRLTCEFCSNLFHGQLSRCPHCERPAASYPNVHDSSRPEEVEALEARHAEARVRARDRGTDGAVDELERALARARAVRTVRIHELQRLVSSERETMARYYQLLNAGLTLPEDEIDGVDWDRLRRVAEAATFSTYADQLHFAALTIDDRYLSSYGHAAVFLHDDLIGHRASVFEDNNVLWRRRVDEAGPRWPDWEVPPGYRAPWEERARLGVAKLADRVTGDADLSELVLWAGNTTADDSMIEVHIYGALTLCCVASVRVQRRWMSEGLREELDERVATTEAQGEAGFEWRMVS